ncbi:MAG: iron chaperone [Acidimicrobiales bacterium]
MSAAEIDRYLSQLEEPRRTTLKHVREAILRVVPDAEECISYGLPAFRVQGKVVAGFAAFKNHLSYFPHSGSVLDEIGDELAGYTMTKGSLHFPVDQPLPHRLVERLITVRLRQIRG